MQLAATAFAEVRRAERGAEVQQIAPYVMTELIWCPDPNAAFSGASRSEWHEE